MGYVGSCRLCTCLEGRQHPLPGEEPCVVVVVEWGTEEDLEDKTEMERQVKKEQQPEVNRGWEIVMLV